MEPSAMSDCTLLLPQGQEESEGVKPCLTCITARGDTRPVVLTASLVRHTLRTTSAYVTMLFGGRPVLNM